MHDQNKQTAILNYTVSLGDDSLILGHRLAEWCRNGPFLEEDIALTNTALDFIGRARMFYGYAAQLSDHSKTEDDFAYLRDEREFKNFLLFELPRGDFAYTMVRQFLTDAYYLEFLTALQQSTDQPLAAIADKTIKESRYHFRRSHDWLLRLGDGTAESHHRSQTALDSLWGYTDEMFELTDSEQILVDQGVAVDTTKLKTAWLKRITATITEASLTMPETDWVVRGGRQGYHTENLGHILTELQYLHRSMPGLQW